MNSALGTLLLQSGIVDERQLQEYIETAQRRNISLWTLIVDEKQISEESLADSFATWLKVPRIHLASAQIDFEAIKLIPEELARKHMCLPMQVQGKSLVVCMANPSDYSALQDLQFVSGMAVQTVVSTRTEVTDGIEEYYATDSRVEDFLSNVSDAEDFRILGGESETVLDATDGRRSMHLPPVVKICNLVLRDAIKMQASDIHIEVGLNAVQVRYRVDGVLRDHMEIPKWLQPAVVSRLKILAKLDIGERRRPQDGRLKVQINKKSIDLRLSTLPTHFGEKVVMRVLGSSELPQIAKLGYSEKQMQVLDQALQQPQGMILATGPTGSGKSTSLYALLQRRRSPELNIVTVEDPIEYQISGINQVQVNPKAGLTFADCLRSILRQDPDIILVGEIRDLETAEIAFNAAMTGHLVLSTLHTNNSIATISRLLDLGVDPFAIAGSLTLVNAQRLARRLCTFCRETYSPDPKLLEKLRLNDGETQFYRGRGCAACGQTGYSGRIGIYEMLRITNSIKELIHRRATDIEIRRAAASEGTRFLLEEAMDKVRAGITSLDEILRVVQLEEEELRRCPQCEAFISSDFSTCPYCLHGLRNLCRNCGQELKPEWRICPYCDRDHAGNLSAGVTSTAIATAGAAGAAAQAPALQPRAAARPGRQPGPAAKKPRILVVEDDESIKTIIAMSLRQMDVPVEVLEASDGEEGLMAIRTGRVDLVVLDITMPRMDGFTVCERLRSDVRTAFIPVLMLTASADETNRTKGYLVGTDDYMAKPFAVPELHARIKRLLRRTYGL